MLHCQQFSQAHLQQFLRMHSRYLYPSSISIFSQGKSDGKESQHKEDREEEAGLILVLQGCAGDADNLDITRMTVPPIHGSSHLRMEGGRVGSSSTRVHPKAQ